MRQPHVDFSRPSNTLELISEAFTSKKVVKLCVEVMAQRAAPGACATKTSTKLGYFKNKMTTAILAAIFGRAISLSKAIVMIFGAFVRSCSARQGFEKTVIMLRFPPSEIKEN